MAFALSIMNTSRQVCDSHGMVLLYRHTPVGLRYGC